MDTRDQIMAQALALYNAHGLYAEHGQQVTARTIAEAVGISDGNLRYHFRTREDIAYALYLKLVAELNPTFQAPPPAGLDLAQVYQLMAHTYDCLYRYRFLMQDFVGVMRRIPRIRTHFRALQRQRQAEFGVIFEALVAQGLFQPEPYPGAFAALLERFEILSDFWMAAAEILYEGPEADRLSHYLRLNFQALYPYLTPTGQAQFHSLLGV